jgi:hypothetical protein
MATDQSVADAFGGPAPRYRVSINPTTGNPELVTTSADSSTVAIPGYLYVDPKGDWRVETSPDAAVNEYQKDINAAGARDIIAKKLYDNKYINQKQYTSKNATAYLAGLKKYIADFSVDQINNVTVNNQTTFTPFVSWAKSAAGASGAIGVKGNETGTYTTAQLSSREQAGFQLDNYFYDQIGRKATSAEKKTYLDALNQAENQAAAKRTFSNSTLTGQDSRVVTSKDIIVGAGGLTQADFNRIQASVLAPVVESMSTDQLMKTKGAIAKTITDLQTFAANYALPNYTPDIAKKDIVSRIREGGVTGSTTTDAEQLAIREMAKTYYPNLSKQIDSGVKISTLGNTYAAQMEKTLELPTGSVANNHKYVIQALQNKNAAGQAQDGVMNMDDFIKVLRSDPSWANTQNAREEAAGYVNQIGKMMGFVA